MSKKVGLLLLLGVLFCAGSVGWAEDLIMGYVLVEFYDGTTGSTMDDLYGSSLYPDNATEMVWLESFETPTNRADNYGTRVGGYLIPPETGDYTFYIASDDASELWLSPDETYEGAQMIATVPGWASVRQWDKDPNQTSAPVSLVAGQKYYIEADHIEGGGGDNLAVGWTGPGIGDAIRVIDGQYLSPYIYGQDDPLIVEYYKARVPSPADEGVADSLEPTLSWTPIIYADHYDVYLSMNEQDVNEGSVTALQSDTNSLMVTGLQTNAQYYWRVDGVESDGTVYTGSIWSFTVVPPTAIYPSPLNGILFVDPNADLSWTAGLGAIEHHLYFGSDADEVVAGTNGADKGVMTETTFDPGTLEEGVTYYWRVDEFDGTQTHTGALWQFQVEYEVPLSDDPNLIGWWKMEEGADGRVVDWSGHGNDGTIAGDPMWVVGEDGMALDFDGEGDIVETGKYASELGIGGAAPRTVATWMYVRSFNGAAPYEMGGGNSGQFSVVARSENRWRLQHWYADTDFDMVAQDEWIHLTHTYDGTADRIYKNGELVTTFEVVLNTTDNAPFTLAQFRYTQFDGILDDMRLYNVAVDVNDIATIMRGNLLKSWNPSPKRSADVDIEQVTSLSFNAGDGAVLHDIYFGTSALAVEEALADANLSPEYMGRQEETSFDLTGQVEMGMTYYWRVDEIDPNGVLTKGRVWSFNVVDYLIIDDFESYDDDTNPVFYTWLDGYDDDAGNGTGGIIGNDDLPYMETDIVHGGNQAVPFQYRNGKSSREHYSEVSLSFAEALDFTRSGVTHLQLSFYGNVENDAEPFYVALEDASGQVAEVVYADSEALAVAQWQDWTIALSDFAGMNLQAVKVLHIGTGNRSNPVSGGLGELILDDIILTVAP